MRNTKRQIQKLTLLGVLTALAMMLSYIEAILPPIFPAVPGIKVGLPNVIIIFVLYRMGVSSAALVSLVRITLVSLLFGNPISFLYSAAGAFLSITVMAILKKTDLLSVVGVSVAGGVSHNLGQILAAMILLQTAQIGYYMIVLAITGTLAGLFIGLCGALLTKRFLKT
ncbi:MAG: Gx transporter family protein [Clostridia bacterium]|nr:Gx transporter family protein [Clostridia bacterium]